MTKRERLIAIIDPTDYGLVNEETARIADRLLEHGVIVPPCKVGAEINGEIVHEIEYKKHLSQGGIRTEAFVHTMNKEDLDSVIFCSHPITWEEAEVALAERSNR